MMPVVVLGPLRLSTYWLMYGIAAMVGCTLAYRRATRAGISARDAGRTTLMAVWFGLAGGWLGSPLVASLVGLIRGAEWRWHRGAAFQVGLVTGIAYVLWSAYRLRIPLAQVLDIAALPVVLGQAIGRLGCVAAGCCYGQITDSWLGVTLPDVYGTWLRRYPTQLMSLAGNLSIFLLLSMLEKSWSRRGSPHLCVRPGTIAALYLVLYASKRFMVDLMRADAWPVLVVLTRAQIGSLLLVLTAGGWLLWPHVARPARDRAERFPR